jgi:hypothetical protein
MNNCSCGYGDAMGLRKGEAKDEAKGEIFMVDILGQVLSVSG